MKRFLILFLTVLLAALCFCFASADVESEQLYDRLPESVKSEIPNGASEEGLLEALSFENVKEYFLKTLTSGLKSVSANLLSVTLIILAVMFANAAKNDFRASATAPALNIVSALALGSVVYSTVSSTAASTFSAIYEIALFQQSMLAVIGAALATGGYTVTATVVPTAFVTSINLITQVNKLVFLPLIDVYFALSLANGIYPEGIFSGMTGALKKFMTWGVTAAATLLVGMIGLQKSIAKAGDSALSGAVKVTISSAIPVVGGVMKDAYSAVAGSMSAIRASAGVLGIIAVLVMLLPAVIKALIYMTMYRISSSFALMSGDKSAGTLLKNISSIWDVLFAIVVSEGAFTIIATAFLVEMGNLL